jgi:hypothetical protein
LAGCSKAKEPAKSKTTESAQAAQNNPFASFVEPLQDAEKPAADKPGPALKSLVVSGGGFAAAKNNDTKSQPSYSLSFTGVFAAPVNNVDFLMDFNVIADSGQRVESWQCISFPRLGPSGKTFTCVMEIDLPNKAVKTLKAIEGTLQYTVADRKKEVDLGITEFKVGAKGTQFGAEITAAGLEKSSTAPGQELTLKLTHHPVKTEGTALYDSSGQKINLNGGGGSGDEINFYRDKPFPTKGRIVLVVYEQFRAPFKLTDVPIKGQ